MLPSQLQAACEVLCNNIRRWNLLKTEGDHEWNSSRLAAGGTRDTDICFWNNFGGRYTILPMSIDALFSHYILCVQKSPLGLQQLIPRWLSCPDLFRSLSEWNRWFALYNEQKFIISSFKNNKNKYWLSVYDRNFMFTYEEKDISHIALRIIKIFIT